MSLTFPASPTIGDTYTVGARTWTWSGTIWEITGTVAAAGSIGTAELASSAVTAAKIASNAVTEAKINDGAVTQAKLASGLSGITVTTTANRSAVIPSPFTGQFIFLTDTSQLQRWDGSAWVVAITTVPTGAPTSVAVSGSPLSSTVTLTFSAGPDGGSTITNYQYALSTDAGSTYGSHTALSPADGTSPITITGLSPGTAYLVKLKAVNALGAGSSESSAVSFTTASLSFEYLVIAGGGGGGGGDNNAGGGGGGAGGYRTNVVGATSGGGGSAEAAMSLALGTYAVTVGGGGVGRVGATTNTNGVDSVFGTITSLGGGKGGQQAGYAGSLGGSGGGGGGGDGGGVQASTSGAGTANQGYAGGRGGHHSGTALGGGGGGGAGALGIDYSSPAGGNGGAGLSSSITGSAVTRGGGGGGSINTNTGARTPGSGGAGGGGQGGYSPAEGGVGGTNTGGGGGGGAHPGTVSGGNGGSGIVIVRYLTAGFSDRTVTGGTATTSGSYTVRTFLASGSLVIS